MAQDFFLLAKTVKVAVICGALHVVTRLSVPDHLPLMTSPSDQFLKLKDRFEVSMSRDGSLALNIGAHDRESALFNLCLNILSQALLVVVMVAGAQAMYVLIRVFK